MDWTDTYNDLPRISGLPLYMYVYISLKVSYYTIYIYIPIIMSNESYNTKEKNVYKFTGSIIWSCKSFKKETLSKKKKKQFEKYTFLIYYSF